MAQERLSPEQEVEIQKLLTAANLCRMRGKWIDAEDTYRKAIDISPKDLRIRNLLVDVLIELGKTDLAIEEIKAAMQMSPGNVQLETKYAKLVLQKGESAYRMSVAEDMLQNPHKYVDKTRKPAMAVILALILPGLGQLYYRQYVKAAVIFGVFLLFMISFAALQPQGSFTIYSLGDLVTAINPMVEVLGIASLAAYVYGIVDASVTGSKGSKKQQQITF
ncbi:MAG TPA: DUF5683 domain-containing protein [Armatimonadota bacterium]